MVAQRPERTSLLRGAWGLWAGLPALILGQTMLRRCPKSEGGVKHSTFTLNRHMGYGSMAHPDHRLPEAC